METLDKILEVPTSNTELYEQIEEIDIKLHQLLMMGANDEKLVDQKRLLLKELFNI